MSKPQPPNPAHIDDHTQLARRSSWLIVCLMLCLFVGAMATLTEVAFKLNSDEIDRTKRLAKKATEARLKGLSSTLMDYAYWDEAYEHTHGQVDISWAERKVDIGRSLLSEYGLNSVFILDSSMVTRYALVEGEFNGHHATEWIDGDLKGLLAEAKAAAGQRVVAKGALTVKGRPALIIAAAIVPTSYELNAPRDELAYLVFVDAICPKSLSRMADAFDLPGLRLGSAQSAVSLELPAQPPIYLTWDIAKPGADFLKALMPILLLASVIFSTGAWVVLRRSIRAAEEIDRGREAEAQIAYLSKHDPLTGLPSRSYAFEMLTEKLSSRRTDSAFAVIFIDLSGFKHINECLGHFAADQLLIDVARRFSLELEQRDFLARLGGDQFLVITPEVSTPGLTALCQSLVASFDRPIASAEHELRVGLRIGIAQCPVDSHDAQELLRLADIALYEAKSCGSHGWQLYNSEMKNRIEERRTLEQDLKRAIQEDQFKVVLQPRFDITGKRVVGAEALVRWLHPEKGLLQPGAFIPLAEETGLIVGISDIVLHRACTLIENLNEAIFVSVNLSCVEFMRGDLLARIERALRLSALLPSRLEIEITESVMIDNAKRALSLMNDLKALGIKLSMDDFGTGYSSLSYLSVYPFDGIKVDRSFVMNLSDPSTNNQAIVKAVVAMGKSMGMTVTAEGVETAEQLQVLQSLGCDQIQGFHLGRPMEPELFAELLHRQDRMQETVEKSVRALVQ